MSRIRNLLFVSVLLLLLSDKVGIIQEEDFVTTALFNAHDLNYIP